MVSVPLEGGKMTKSIVQTRIEERLEALGMNPFQAAEKAGLHSSYIYELTSGKKGSIRQKAIPAVAKALECTPEYLMGIADSPQANTNGTPPQWASGDLQVAGIIEQNAWRKPEQLGLKVHPDTRYDPEQQEAYLVRGDHWRALGIFDGSVLVVSTTTSPRSGDLVVISSERENGERNLALVLVEKAQRAEDLAGGSSKISGVVTMQIRTF